MTTPSEPETDLTKAEYRYVYVQSAVGAAVVNLLLNGALGWGATRGMAALPLWQAPGVVPDLLATAFGVAFGTCFGVLLQVRGDLKRGKITIPRVSKRLEARLSRLPRVLWMRALLVGLVAMMVFAPPVVGAVAVAYEHVMPRWDFVVVKGAFAAFEAALVTPFLVLAALRDCRAAPVTPLSAE